MPAALRQHDSQELHFRCIARASAALGQKAPIVQEASGACGDRLSYYRVRQDNSEEL